MEQFIRESYTTFEFVPIRLSNAFDKRWWKMIRGGPLAKSDYASRFDTGVMGASHYRSGTDAHILRSCTQTHRRNLFHSPRVAPNILPLAADPDRRSLEHPNPHSGTAPAYRPINRLVSRVAGDILDIVGDFTHLGGFTGWWV